ncbi:hypothetical protein BCR32DRAFT_328754, partial [Anaeromyces robustus]
MNIDQNTYYSPILILCNNKDDNTIKYLVEYGADVNCQNWIDRKTSLIHIIIEMRI